MKLKLNSELLLLAIYTSVELFHSQVTEAQSPLTIKKCIDFYVTRVDISPDTAFAFCEKSAGTENYSRVVRCTRYYSLAGVSPDTAFAFCEKSTGTENYSSIKKCIKFYGGSGVSPDNAFKRCTKEAG